MGMGLLALFAMTGARAASGMEEIGEELRRDAQVRGGGPVVDGEIARRVTPPRDDGPARLG
jgi:hypothetical protein